jgi:hypothetical protein
MSLFIDKNISKMNIGKVSKRLINARLPLLKYRELSIISSLEENKYNKFIFFIKINSTNIGIKI